MQSLQASVNQTPLCRCMSYRGDNYRADGMHESIGDLICSHVSVDIKRSCQLLPQVRVYYVLQLFTPSAIHEATVFRYLYNVLFILLVL